MTPGREWGGARGHLPARSRTSASRPTETSPRRTPRRTERRWMPRSRRSCQRLPARRISGEPAGSRPQRRTWPPCWQAAAAAAAAAAVATRGPRCALWCPPDQRKCRFPAARTCLHEPCKTGPWSVRANACRDRKHRVSMSGEVSVCMLREDARDTALWAGAEDIYALYCMGRRHARSKQTLSCPSPPPLPCTSGPRWPATPPPTQLSSASPSANRCG